jgi:hypothetical protein
LISGDDVGRLIDPLVPDSLDEALVAAVRDGQWTSVSPTRLRAALKGYSCETAADAILQAATDAVAHRSDRAKT